MKYLCWTILASCVLGLIMLSGCTSPLSSTSPARVSISHDQATIQALEKRLQGRERTIAIQNYQLEVLSSQLDALKRIDQDIQDPRRSVRRSVNVTP